MKRTSVIINSPVDSTSIEDIVFETMPLRDSQLNDELTRKHFQPHRACANFYEKLQTTSEL
jgi:hypothetical protein